MLFPPSVSLSHLGPHRIAVLTAMCCPQEVCRTCPPSPHSSPAPKSSTVLSLFGPGNLVRRALLHSTVDELATQNQDVDLREHVQGCRGYGGPWSSLGRCLLLNYYGLRACTCNAPLDRGQSLPQLIRGGRDLLQGVHRARRARCVQGYLAHKKRST